MDRWRVVKALVNGDWLLLDNVNFCSPNVLDRLNPLFEKDGELLISECGMIDGEPRIVKPHPDFRCFLIMNPEFGEISRAMRNRCVEISFLPLLSQFGGDGDGAAKHVTKCNPRDIQAAFHHDARLLLASKGVTDSFIADCMCGTHLWVHQALRIVHSVVQQGPTFGISEIGQICFKSSTLAMAIHTRVLSKAFCRSTGNSVQ